MIFVGACVGVVVVHFGSKRTGTAEALASDDGRIGVQLVKDMKGAIGKQGRSSLEQIVVVVAPKPDPFGGKVIVVNRARGTRRIPGACRLIKAVARTSADQETRPVARTGGRGSGGSNASCSFVKRAMQAEVMTMVHIIGGGRDAVSRGGGNREHEDAQREISGKNRTQPATRETHTESPFVTTTGSQGDAAMLY